MVKGEEGNAAEERALGAERGDGKKPFLLSLSFSKDAGRLSTGVVRKQGAKRKRERETHAREDGIAHLVLSLSLSHSLAR